MNVTRAVTAGLIGGVLIDAFLITIRAVPFPGVWQFVASTVVGPAAFTSSGYIALGLLMHFGISIVFALAYAAIASRARVLAANPIVGGAAFGVAVMIVMQIVLALARAAQPPTVAGIVTGLVAHVVFFGLPVAWYIVAPYKRRRLAA